MTERDTVEPAYWGEAKELLRAADPILAALIDAHEEPPLRSFERPFETIVHSVVGQQISAKAADAVWGRLVDVLGEVEPENIARQEAETLRAVGLSGRKVEYIVGLATECPWIVSRDWSQDSDAEVMKRLCAIRGVGPWTAEMVMIFALLRPDVLPLKDIGVIRAIEDLYNDKEALDSEQITAIAEAWRPYRTVATWYLWRHIDADPVEY